MCGSGFGGDIQGWGLKDANCERVTAGQVEEGAGWQLKGRIVEMVLDMGSQTLTFSTEGEDDIVIGGISGPVVPAICLYGNSATLESSSFETGAAATPSADSAGAQDPLFGAGVEHFWCDGVVVVAADGRRVEANNSFILFDTGPISGGVFRCAVAFGTGGDGDQHIGVLPQGAAARAVSESMCGSGFGGDIQGWGLKDANCERVTAGQVEEGAGWQLKGRIVEMVLDMGSQTLTFSTEGEDDIVIGGISGPVVPAICLFENSATLESSSFEVDSCSHAAPDPERCSRPSSAVSIGSPGRPSLPGSLRSGEASVAAVPTAGNAADLVAQSTEVRDTQILVEGEGLEQAKVEVDADKKGQGEPAALWDRRSLCGIWQLRADAVPAAGERRETCKLLSDGSVWYELHVTRRPKRTGGPQPELRASGGAWGRWALDEAKFGALSVEVSYEETLEKWMRDIRYTGKLSEAKRPREVRLSLHQDDFFARFMRAATLDDAAEKQLKSQMAAA